MMKTALAYLKVGYKSEIRSPKPKRLEAKTAAVSAINKAVRYRTKNAIFSVRKFVNPTNQDREVPNIAS